MKLFSSETRVNLRTHTKARFVREGSETLVLSILDEDKGVHDEPIVINGSRTMLDKLCASVPPSMPSWEPADDGIPLECPTRSVDAWWALLDTAIDARIGLPDTLDAMAEHDEGAAWTES